MKRTWAFFAIIGVLMLGMYFAPQEGASYSDRETLASRSFSLERRYANPHVNEVMKNNILLTLAYLRGKSIDPQNVDWQEVREPFTFELTLEKGRSFAFQNAVLEKYKGTVAYSPNVHFSSAEGFESDGYLTGDGVCHLASLMYWAARDAGLVAEAPVNHDFAKIEEVPKEYGVSIYSNPGDPSVGAAQNLYIVNNKDAPVTMKFVYDGKDLTVSFNEKEEGFLAKRFR